MDNKFNIKCWRFHVKDSSKLLVQGYFHDGEIGENKIEARLDQKLLHCETNAYLEIRDLEKFMEDRKYTENMYFFWIDIPKDLSSYKELHVYNCCGSIRDKIITIPVSKVTKRQKKMAKYIEDGHLTKNGFTFTGWYAAGNDAKMKVFDPNGKELKIEKKFIKRADVERQYPECEGQEVYGFKAVHVGMRPRKIRIQISCDGRQSEYKLVLAKSKAEKIMYKAEKVAFKAYIYYQQFGLKRTVERAYQKALGKEGNSYSEWRRKYMPGVRELREQKKFEFSFTPKISIVIPLYKTDPEYLQELITSIKNQTYSNWELCLSDGSGEQSPIYDILEKYKESDRRIKVVHNKRQLQISDNTNEALKVSTGDFIAFADHDDVLSPNALYECVKEINEDREIEILYSDEDKISMDGKEYFEPHFKPDFNIDLLRSTNYICHLFVVKREIYEKAGMLRAEYDGAQDYDFVLRCIEQSDKIRHIPKILYHWRAHKDSTAENPESKAYAFIAGENAIRAHYARVGIDAEVTETKFHGFYRSKYKLQSEPLVSIVIPNKDHVDDLRKCIKAIEEKASYKNIEYIIVENNSKQPQTFEYYNELEKSNSKVRVVYWEGEFNYSKINNFGVQYANGEYLLLLNNDTEIINPDCIEELLAMCMRDDVGIVGARLFYEDDTIQHAGVIVGIGGVAAHAFCGADKKDPGYFGRIICIQDLNAVTAACMMVKKSVFEEVGGLDEELAVAFNDVDFCLKVRQAGHLIVYNPYARLHHFESKSRGTEDTEEKIRRFQGEINRFILKWTKELEKGDCYYNPNLTLSNYDFSLRK